jgi:hypothetical protein
MVDPEVACRNRDIFPLPRSLLLTLPSAAVAVAAAGPAPDRRIHLNRLPFSGGAAGNS